MRAASTTDYCELARRRLPHFLFEYIDGGSYDEVTLRRNVEDLRKIALLQRVLRDVSEIDLSTTLLGQPLSMPVALAPVGLSGMNARRGEIQAARAAHEAGVQFCLSTVGVCSLPEVATAVTRPIWFQLYVLRDRQFVRDMLAEAREHGVTTLVFTVDLPLPGTRYRDHRSGLTNAASLTGKARRLAQCVARPAWAWDVGVNSRPHTLGNLAPVLGANSGMEDFLCWMSRNFDPTFTWKDLDFIRAQWPGELVVKGILDPEDAKAVAASGAQGLVVSNHGGRQLDGVISSTAALPAIVDAVGDRLTVLVDGGVRTGLDVVRLLALGADGVLLGRAWAYALAGAGGNGVAHVLKLIEAEMRVAMALTGRTKVADLSRSDLAW